VFAPDTRFDRIVSVEMFEHMMNWRQLMSRVRAWLKPDGRFFLAHLHPSRRPTHESARSASAVLNFIRTRCDGTRSQSGESAKMLFVQGDSLV
jgi:cyclopropane fatty-acyl-phospholipid synthase-like methyltransferase